jgi:hypothetical protein
MRLWTLHPRYLDPQGLVALWREALLAQKVLRGRTRGYRHHPQLERFKAQPDPVASIARYLRAVHAEAERRGYRFTKSRIARRDGAGPIVETRGQMGHEWRHLARKLKRRAPAHYRQIAAVRRPRAHPLFTLKAGPVRDWERPRGQGRGAAL